MNNDGKEKAGTLIRISEERGLIARSATLAKRGLESLKSLEHPQKQPQVESKMVELYKKVQPFIADETLSTEEKSRRMMEAIAEIKSSNDELAITSPKYESVIAVPPLFSKLDDETDQADWITVEEMRDLPYVEIEDILDTAEMSRNGSLLKMNAASHELLRRSFEESRFKAAEAQGKTIKQSDYEDLFVGIFLPPEKVQESVEILRSKAAEAESYYYPDEQVQTFKDHADMFEAAAKDGQGAVGVFILDSKLPHVIFHQSDYFGAADKSILNRHTDVYKEKLDAHPIVKILWENYYSKFNEYRGISSQKLLDATLRACIPNYLLEHSEAKLGAFGITPEIKNDYMLKWFKGYAEKNGIKALDYFDRDEIGAKNYIERVRTAYK